MHRFNIRSEVLLPEIFPNKQPAMPISPAQRVLYDVSEPKSDIYGEEQNVRPTSRSSRSSDETLRGDNMTSTSLKDGWNTWGQYRDHDSMDESSAEPHPALDHDSELNQGRDSRRSSLDSRVQGPVNDMFRPSGMPNGMKRKSMCETFMKLY